MTQKELLYVEDAYRHEDNMIRLIDYFIDNLSSDEIISFMEKEKKKHSRVMDDLMNLLEACND